jgi:hypothetical protein
MKTFVQFLLEWEMFQTKVLDKTETHIFCSYVIFTTNIITKHD